MIRHYVCWLTLLATTQVLATDYSPAIPLTSAKIQDHQTLTRIAFGSCFDQQEDDRIFNVISNQQPDLFLMIGDNVYPESEAYDHSLQSLRNAYGTLAKSREFNLLRERTPIMVTWDDHDYGLNDAGGDWPLRSASEDLFEYVWVPEGDPRHTRDGIYFSRTIGSGDRRVQLIFLDTRSFRSPLRSSPNPLITKYQPDESPHKTMLGYRQWAWLEAMLTQTADLRIIVSSIQIIADGHAWEGWKMLPRERLKLYTLIKATGAKNVVLLSGDRHSAGLYQNNDVASYPVWELTSSSLNKPMKTFVPKITSEPGPFRIGDNYHHVNFGMIDIYWENRRVVLSIRDSTGKSVQDTTINLEEN